MGTIYPFAGITRIRFHGFDLSPFLFADFHKRHPYWYFASKDNGFSVEEKNSATDFF